uniref:Secreted protein n=1 Tax=Triticum urartu TaxID=4572 RepID=A0A8R7UQM1_TRIUA
MKAKVNSFASLVKGVSLLCELPWTSSAVLIDSTARTDLRHRCFVLISTSQRHLSLMAVLPPSYSSNTLPVEQFLGAAPLRSLIYSCPR